MGNPLLESSVPFQGQSSLTEVCLNISARPAHPEKYNVATSRLPWKLKFGMEALFNQTNKSTTASLPEMQWLAMIFLFWLYLSHFKTDFDGAICTIKVAN